MFEVYRVSLETRRKYRDGPKAMMFCTHTRDAIKD